MEDIETNLKWLSNSQPDLLSTIYAFNYSPVSYLHSSRRRFFFNGVLPDVVWNEKRVAPKISALLLQELELQNQPYLVFPDSKWPLALLSRERLARLANYIGAVVYGPHIRAGLTRDHVLHWKTRLGAPVYNFVMHSAMLLPAISLRPVFTEESDIEAMGYSFIEHSLANTPAAMFKRIKLKFPADYKIIAIDQGMANQIVQAVFLILEAEWHSLFISIRR